MKGFSLKDFQFDDAQAWAIINRVVPMVAAPEDHGTFKAFLWYVANEKPACELVSVVVDLLRIAGYEIPPGA